MEEENRKIRYSLLTALGGGSPLLLPGSGKEPKKVKPGFCRALAHDKMIEG